MIDRARSPTTCSASRAARRGRPARGGTPGLLAVAARPPRHRVHEPRALAWTVVLSLPGRLASVPDGAGGDSAGRSSATAAARRCHEHAHRQRRVDRLQRRALPRPGARRDALPDAPARGGRGRRRRLHRRHRPRAGRLREPIRVVHQPNAGHPAGFNTGFREATATTWPAATPTTSGVRKLECQPAAIEAHPRDGHLLRGGRDLRTDRAAVLPPPWGRDPGARGLRQEGSTGATWCAPPRP